MRTTGDTQSFITDLRVRFAVNLANEIAEKNRTATAYECAEDAVHKIFGRWLLDYTGAVKPQLLPIYLRLVCDVEQRMGLHRRRKNDEIPNAPAAIAWPLAANNIDARSAQTMAAA